MRRLLTWIVVTLGIAAIVRRLRRRGRQDDVATAPEADDDPADELRRKLAESRTEESSGAEPSESAEASVEERRADVHEQGRSTLDEMRSADES